MLLPRLVAGALVAAGLNPAASAQGAPPPPCCGPAVDTRSFDLVFGHELLGRFHSGGTARAALGAGGAWREVTAEVVAPRHEGAGLRFSLVPAWEGPGALPYACELALSPIGADGSSYWTGPCSASGRPVLRAVLIPAEG